MRQEVTMHWNSSIHIVKAQTKRTSELSFAVLIVFRDIICHVNRILFSGESIRSFERAFDAQKFGLVAI